MPLSTYNQLQIIIIVMVIPTIIPFPYSPPLQSTPPALSFHWSLWINHKLTSDGSSKAPLTITGQLKHVLEIYLLNPNRSYRNLFIYLQNNDARTRPVVGRYPYIYSSNIEKQKWTLIEIFNYATTNREWHEAKQSFRKLRCYINKLIPAPRHPLCEPDRAHKWEKVVIKIRNKFDCISQMSMKWKGLGETSRWSYPSIPKFPLHNNSQRTWPLWIVSAFHNTALLLTICLFVLSFTVCWLSSTIRVNLLSHRVWILPFLNKFFFYSFLQLHSMWIGKYGFYLQIVRDAGKCGPHIGRGRVAVVSLWAKGRSAVWMVDGAEATLVSTITTGALQITRN